MLHLHQSPGFRLAAGQVLRRCMPAVLMALVGLVGCRTTSYRAAELPIQLRVSPANRTNELNLASMASHGSGSSQIGPGDLVEMTILSGGEEEAPEPQQARVSQDGKVNVPLVGEVPVAGLEPFDAGQRIAAAAIDRGVYRQPSVVLKVTEQAVNRVTVLGAVNEPGTHELPRGSSDLLAALAAAGGLDDEASTQVEILRQESPTFLAEPSGKHGGVVPAGYEEMDTSPTLLDAEPDAPTVGRNSSRTAARTDRIDLAAASPSRPADYTLSDRDVVLVRPQEKRVIHVSGLVNEPDEFELPNDQDVHVLDAIAMAGGAKSPVADKVLVIRQLEGMSEPAIIEVSISKAKKDGDENLRLASGDLVSVESTVLTNTVETLSTFFRVGLSLGGSVVAF